LQTLSEPIEWWLRGASGPWHRARERTTRWGHNVVKRELVTGCNHHTFKAAFQGPALPPGADVCPTCAKLLNRWSTPHWAAFCKQYPRIARWLDQRQDRFSKTMREQVYRQGYLHPGQLRRIRFQMHQ
jgi:hypothetical protein